MTNLIPPDYKQCQTLKPNGNTFMTFGGVPGHVRCTNKPVFIALEPKRPGSERGSMSVCKACRASCKKQVPGVIFTEIKWKEFTALEVQMGKALQGAWDYLGMKGSDRPAKIDQRILEALEAFKQAGGESK